MKAIAPGKVIISGEHSVVYGKPALVLAVDLYSRCEIQFQNMQQLTIHLPDFLQSQSFSFDKLYGIKDLLSSRYREFLQGKTCIGNVAPEPFMVFAYLAAGFLTGNNIRLNKGLELTVSSQLPAGGGMGSSASTIMGVLVALSAFFETGYSKESLYEKGLEAENLLHGRSSGVDPYICLMGGFVRFQDKKAQRLSMPEHQFYIIHTGTPVAGTGECVDFVNKHHGGSSIWSEFEQVTWNIEKNVDNRQYIRVNGKH